MVALAVILNIGLLCTYKYLGFLVEILNGAIAGLGMRVIEHERSAFLPIGMSFFTFQALSYVIDVYRGDAKVQKNPLGIAPVQIPSPGVRSWPLPSSTRANGTSSR